VTVPEKHLALIFTLHISTLQPDATYVSFPRASVSYLYFTYEYVPFFLPSVPSLFIVMMTTVVMIT